MPATRRARPPKVTVPLYADDTDRDSEPETPRPQKSGVKKRLSEAFLPDKDGSFSEGRPPLKAVSINDDAAEKRRRRKSAKISVLENAVVGLSSDGMQDPDASGTLRPLKHKQQLKSVAPPPVINVPLDVMSSNFEEWMKMATDNKINAANSWNFALIDYFHDMSLLRNNDDNSINFQRASCTLDGCVKIWTSRVDSVGTETGKLLSNLASDGKYDDMDNENSDNPDADPTQSKKKKTHRPGTTLAKDPSQLRSKKLDLEFSVDPLFKKTCADFDEGGAHGLLMNHLSLGVGTDGGLRVVFDASDSMGRVEDEEIIEEPEDDVDLSYLRAEFLPDLSVLDRKAISHPLSTFAFSQDPFAFDETNLFRNNASNDERDDFETGGDNGMDMDPETNVPTVEEDFFVGDDAVNDDYDLGNIAGKECGLGDDSHTSAGPPGPYVPFDPRRLPNERDLVLAMTDASAEGALDYFDQNFMKNWAGPEHWKLRKIFRRPDADAAAAANKATKVKVKKEPFKIDFLSPPDPEQSLKTIAKELFAPAIRGAGINLPGTGGSSRKGKNGSKEKRDSHLLPDDMHFTSRQLVTLFLKPKFFLKMRGRRAQFNDNGDGEVDEQFWVQAAADQATGRGEDDGDEGNDGAIPFNTQFFHDDYDDGPGFDDGFEGNATGVADVDAGEEDLLAATQGQTRRVRPEFVNYAKKAKRVDVRKLKENIWKGLDIVTSKPASDQQDAMEVDVKDRNPPTDPNEPRQFSQVISKLEKSYPPEKMDEISTSFCFICLLHLANEHGLRLESRNEVSDSGITDADQLTDQPVDNIWNVKIYRNPNATPAS